MLPTIVAARSKERASVMAVSQLRNWLINVGGLSSVPAQSVCDLWCRKFRWGTTSVFPSWTASNHGSIPGKERDFFVQKVATQPRSQ